MGSSGLGHEVPAVFGAPATPVGKLLFKHAAQERRRQIVAVKLRVRRVVGGQLVHDAEPTAQKRYGTGSYGHLASCYQVAGIAQVDRQMLK